MISAILLVKNSMQTLPDVIRSLQWVDEIICVDNGSTDMSVEYAKKAGAKVIQVNEKNFALLRNKGAKASSHEWLLYVDTDEEISNKLRHEIQQITLKKPERHESQAYVIKRKNVYLGEKWPTEDGMIRLIYKPSLIEWFGELHETAKINGSVSELHERIIHRTHRSLSEMVDKTNIWSETESQLRYNVHHPPVKAWRLFRVFLTGFVDSYIRQSGWKAGTVGVIESMYQGFSLFITYAKLWEKQQHK